MKNITTKIASADTEKITVRGLDLVQDIMGKLSFVEMIYFLSTGVMPNSRQIKILDVCLVTLMEHGWTPSSIITRLMIDSVPEESQVAMASGLMALGSVFAGTSEACAKVLLDAQRADEGMNAYFDRYVRECRAQRQPIPGFGHPQHKPDDPRTPRLLALGHEAGFDGAHIMALHCLSKTVDRIAGKHITINATGAIAALLLEIGIEPGIMRGLAVVSRSGGLIGHIVEERQNHSARYIWHLTQSNVPYEE